MINTETPNTETVDQAMIEKEIGKISAFIDTARKHIKEDKMVDAACSGIGYAGNHQSRVAMTYQDDLLEILEEQDVGYILNMECKVHRLREKVSSLPKSGESRGVHLVTAGAKTLRDSAPTPATVPCPMDENKATHATGSMIAGSV